MSCIRPLIYDNVKKEFVRKQDFIFKKHIFKYKNKCKTGEILSLNFLSEKYTNKYIEKFLNENKFITIPCGLCIECIKHKRKQWINRNIIELNNSTSAYFITLTYDDFHIKYFYKGDVFIIDENDYIYKVGDYKCCDSVKSFYTPINSIFYKDIQDFLKRLRAYYSLNYGLKNNIFRYYGVAEYGDKTFRPHYHIIFYNLDLSSFNLQKLFKKNNAIYYKSELFDSIWKNGQCVISNCNNYNIAYTCGYVNKKMNRESQNICYKLGIENIKQFMSRNPGIGYIEDYKKYYEYDNMLYKFGDHNFFDKPLDYYDYKLKIDDEELFEKIKESRKSDFIFDFGDMRLHQNYENKKNILKGIRDYEKKS